MSSLEAVRAAKENMKLCDAMNEKARVTPPALETCEPEETPAKKPKKGYKEKKDEVKSKEKGEVEGKGKDKEKKGEGKKSKDEGSCSGQNTATPTSSAAPRHRHRTKSARFSIDDYQI